MNRFIAALKKWVFLKPDKEAALEFDILNIKTIYYVSLSMCVVQAFTLFMYLFSHLDELDQWTVVGSLISVSFCILLCLAGIIGAGYFRKRIFRTDCHRGVGIFVCVFTCLLVLWGMAASYATYLSGKQIITFFIAELIAVLFIRQRPPITTAIILSSYIIFYVVLNFCVKSGMISVYNLMMMALLSVVGAGINYRLTFSYIVHKNRVNQLNTSLEIIANHDTLTRLKNRYAFNQSIPDYVDTDICLAMADVDGFKAINDTYGHQAGDDLLRSFSDVLQRYFDHEEVYRYGGDEFLIVCRGTDTKKMQNNLREINEAFRGADVRGVNKSFSCSYGCVSGHPKSSAEFLELVNAADSILYEQKEGKGR